MKTNRRRFLAGAAAAGSLAFAAPAVHGAERGKKYRTAIIGSGWWGMNILGAAIDAGRSQVVAMCDVDRNILDAAAAKVDQQTGSQPNRYGDFREMLDREKPEICIVATPDHWHPLAMIAAVEAGAHVYVEKPICHTINEGAAMVKAARRAGRVVQVGTHRRASPHNISGMKFLKEGKAGQIGMVRAFVHYGGGPGEPVPDSEPPAGLDWDVWCGPGPLRPFNKKIHPRGFRQFLDYANGQLGDWGIHWMDQILWWTEEQWPKSVHSVGARHIRRDNTDAPDTQVVNYEFDSFTAVWEHRYYAANNAEKHNVGCYFYGTGGTFHMGWQDGWTFYPVNKSQPPAHEEPQLHRPDDQNIPELWADFLRCVETGERPICDIEIGFRSTTMSLLGMLSMKLGRSVKWDGRQQTIIGDPQANELLKRPYRAPWQYPAS
jgi:predicted dehydrogenase